LSKLHFCLFHEDDLPEEWLPDEGNWRSAEDLHGMAEAQLWADFHDNDDLHGDDAHDDYDDEEVHTLNHVPAVEESPFIEASPDAANSSDVEEGVDVW
jgi:hypothetical protein